MDDIKGCINPVNASYSLHHSGRVPGDVVIDHHIGTMQVHTFRQDFGGDKYPIIFSGVTGSGVEILQHFVTDRFA